MYRHTQKCENCGKLHSLNYQSNKRFEGSQRRRLFWLCNNCDYQKIRNKLKMERIKMNKKKPLTEKIFEFFLKYPNEELSATQLKKTMRLRVSVQQVYTNLVRLAYYDVLNSDVFTFRTTRFRLNKPFLRTFVGRYVLRGVKK